MPVTTVGSLSYFGFFFLSLVLGLGLGFTPATPAEAQADSQNFETLAASALSARENGKPDEAIRNYRAAVELRPSWDEGWWYLGTLLYDTDHFAEAIPALHHVVELDSKVGAGWAFLGLCEFETGDYPDAFVHLQSAQALGFADSPDVEKVALYHLGLLLNLHGEFERATDLLVHAFGPSQLPDQIKTALGLALLRVPLLPVQVDPAKDSLVHAAGETAALLANHEMDGAFRSFEQMLRDYPNTPYLHYEYGVALATASHFEQADAQLREEIRITPHSAAAYKGLAQALKGQGKSEEAAKASRQAAELATQSVDVDAAQIKRYALARGAEVAGRSPSNVPTAESASREADFEDKARLAEAAQRDGTVEEAAILYQSALQLHPDWQEGWRQLGTLAYMQGRYPEAISALQQSVALEAKQPDTWTLLGLSEFETKDYKNSLIHLEHGRAMGFSGNAAAVRVSRYHLALLLNLNGSFDRAIALLIPEVGPGALSEEIQFAMGIALLRIPALPEQVGPAVRPLVTEAGEAAVLLSQSYYDKAFPIFDKMLKEHPTTPFLHYAYGDALASASQYDEAQTQLKEETRVNPSSEIAYIRLASIALVLHDSAGGLADAKKAVALAPESAEAHYVLGRAFLEAGDIPGAIRELEAARRLAPNSPKVHFNLARAYAQAKRSTEAQQERAEFERLNAQMPGQSGSYGDRAARGSAADASMQPLAK